jgi:hypothetical protein
LRKPRQFIAGKVPGAPIGPLGRNGIGVCAWRKQLDRGVQVCEIRPLARKCVVPDLLLDSITHDNLTVFSAVRKANASGKVIFGPRWSKADESTHASNMHTLHLLSDLLGSDAVVFDDRALNKEPFVEDRTHHPAHIATSLDIIEDLHGRGVVSDADRRTYRHRLRTAGPCLVRADAIEVKFAAARNAQHASPEFRALRDSIDLPHVVEIAMMKRPTPNRPADGRQRFRTSGGHEAVGSLSIPDRLPGSKLKTQKIKRDDRKVAAPVRILAIDDLRLHRMQHQLADRKTICKRAP